MKHLLLFLAIGLILSSCGKNSNPITDSTDNVPVPHITEQLKITVIDFNDDAYIYYSTKVEYLRLENGIWVFHIYDEGCGITIPIATVKKLTVEKQNLQCK
jgi:hypothetical protein